MHHELYRLLWRDEDPMICTSVGYQYVFLIGKSVSQCSSVDVHPTLHAEQGSVHKQAFFL